MKFKDFSEKDIVRALKRCSSPKGNRCSSCPIFGKGFQSICIDLLMQRAASIIESRQEERKNKDVVDAVLEEACRQWCEFIDEAPERKDGKGFANFFHGIFEEKEKEYAEVLNGKEIRK